MKKSLIKVLLSFSLLFLFCIPVFSVDAKVTYVKGKVEVSHNGGEWIPLKTGDVISQSDTINTGFQSEARINLNGSIMAVPALTRITIETLKTSNSKDTVSLYVNTGAVRSKVTHTDNKKIDYTARTAVAVASVRGTDYTVTAGGLVSCFEGAVAVTSAKEYERAKSKEQEAEEGETEEEESATENNTTADTTDSSDSGSESTSDDGNAVSADNNVTSEDNTSATVADKGTEGDRSSEGNKDKNESAKATTPARDISSSTSDNAVVVAEGQTTKFTSTGNPNKPVTQTADKTEKIKNTVNTQAQKDATANGGTKTETVPVEAPIPVTGTLIVNISFEN